MRNLRIKLSPIASINGPSRDIENVYEKHDILLHFAFKEGLPNVVIEAMSKGCLVFVRNLPGISPFLIKDGINGILFETIDEAKVKLKRLLDYDYDLDHISSMARNTIRERFSIKSTRPIPCLPARAFNCRITSAGL